MAPIENPQFLLFRYSYEPSFTSI